MFVGLNQFGKTNPFLQNGTNLIKSNQTHNGNPVLCRIVGASTQAHPKGVRQRSSGDERSRN
jgi:hypothetical protein